MWCFLLFFPHSEQPHVHYSERLLIQMFSGFWCSQAEFMYDHHQFTINGSPHIKMAAGLSPWDHLFFRVESSLQTGFVHKSGCLPISVCSHQPALGQLQNFRAYSWLLFLNVLSLDNFLYFMPSWCPTGQVSSESYLHGFLKHKSPLGFREDNTQLSNPLDEHALA